MGKIQEIPRVLVTAVGVPPGLNVLRALKESGCCELIAADADPRSPGLYQYSSKHVVLPLARDTDAYLEALIRLVRLDGVSIIVPCLEEEVEVIARYQAELRAAGACLLLPDLEVMRAVTDKGVITGIAASIGIDCPLSLVLAKGTTSDERAARLSEFIVDCPLPWIVKPVWGHGMRDVTHVARFDQAMAATADIGKAWIVQEFIPGAVGSMYLAGLLYDAGGQIVRRFTSRSIRTLYPSGGPATAGISVERPEIIDATECLVARVGTWRGPLNAEWMLDPRDQRLKFIEINPRMWGYGYLATASGLNFPEAIVALSQGRDIGPDPGFRVGVTMLRSTVDLIFSDPPYELRN